MPPTRRGGRRAGQPGKAYPNRTDLNAQPVRTATGQPYGKAAEQAAIQRVAPLPQTAAPQAAPVTGRAPLPALDAPTERPNEPITSGAPFGAGPGPAIANPEALDLQTLAPYLPALEYIASQPTSSSSVRNFVRRVRSALPPDTGTG